MSGRLANFLRLNGTVTSSVNSKSANALAALTPVNNNNSLRPQLKAHQNAILHPISPELHNKLDAINPNNALMDIRNISFENDDMAHICKYLQTHVNIHRILLYKCRISEDDVKVLADTLRNNTTLKILSMVQCRISNTGATSLANALQSNNTLTELNLMDNRIGDDGATALAHTMALYSLRSDRPNTFKLNLRGNPFNHTGIAHLIAAQHGHNTVQVALDHHLLATPMQVRVGNHGGNRKKSHYRKKGCHTKKRHPKKRNQKKTRKHYI